MSAGGLGTISADMTEKIVFPAGTLLVQIGGPGMLAFVVPGLLWCALSYSAFTSSLLSLVVCLWTMAAVDTGVLNFAPAHASEVLSLRVGVTLLALGLLGFCLRRTLVGMLISVELMLNGAGLPSDMNAPGLRLHPLQGKLKGHWAVTVQANWRLTFVMRDGDAHIINYLDYH